MASAELRSEKAVGEQGEFCRCCCVPLLSSTASQDNWCKNKVQGPAHGLGQSQAQIQAGQRRD